MNKRLVELIKEEFNALLEAQTNWGRNQVKAAYDQAVANATLRLLDEM